MAGESSQAGELRAFEVIAAASAAGTTSSFDPGRRWERAVAATHEAPLMFTPSLEVRVDPAAWRSIDVSQSEYSLSPEIYSTIQEHTPQAFLRDLDRPESVPGALFEIREGTQLIGRWEEGVRDVEEARRRPERPKIIPAAELFLEDQERRRRFFAEQWKPLLPDDAPRRKIDLYATFE